MPVRKIDYSRVQRPPGPLRSMLCSSLPVDTSVAPAGTRTIWQGNLSNAIAQAPQRELVVLGGRSPRVGAILQALIAREPVEHRPTIRAWLPAGIVPPQVTIVSAKPSTELLMVRSLGSTAVSLPLFGDEVLYWRNDIF